MTDERKDRTEDMEQLPPEELAKEIEKNKKKVARNIVFIMAAIVAFIASCIAWFVSNNRVNGILGGIGGAYLVLVQLGVFTENMISGRGYIALATVILGRYTPFGMFGAALLFGAANALQIRLQTIGVSISPFLLAILPYALTLIAMLGAAGKNSEPEALSKPYVKGAR